MSCTALVLVLSPFPPWVSGLRKKMFFQAFPELHNGFTSPSGDFSNQRRLQFVSEFFGQYLMSLRCRGVRRKFSRGWGGFSKKKLKNLSTFDLGRPGWFSELSENTINTLFFTIFLHRRQILQKHIQAKDKDVLSAFFSIRKKSVFSARTSASILVVLAPKAP